MLKSFSKVLRIAAVINLDVEGFTRRRELSERVGGTCLEHEEAVQCCIGQSPDLTPAYHGAAPDRPCPGCISVISIPDLTPVMTLLKAQWWNNVLAFALSQGSALGARLGAGVRAGPLRFAISLRSQLPVEAA
jgi:hypothetical protein